MKYPVICLLEEDTNNKLFIIPNKNSLMHYANLINKNDLDKLNYGISVFLSLMPETIVKEPDNLLLDDIQLHSLKVISLGAQLIKFNQQTLLGPKDYDYFFLMNNLVLKSIEDRDLKSIYEIVKINKENSVNKQQLKLQ